MATEKKVYKSTKDARKRCVFSYLPTKYHNLTVSYAEYYEMRKSAVVKIAIKEFFDRMPKQEQARIMNHGKNHY